MSEEKERIPAYLCTDPKGCTCGMSNKIRICPDCKTGKFYNQKSKSNWGRDLQVWICYLCGFREDNSEGYIANPKLSVELFRKWFPSEIKYYPSPGIDRRFRSPEELTEPKLSNYDFQNRVAERAEKREYELIDRYLTTHPNELWNSATQKLRKLGLID